MSPVEERLLQALTRLEGLVSSLRTATPKPDLRTALRELDELTAQLPAAAHPQLRHLLVNQSYQNARLWLQAKTASSAPTRPPG